MRKTKGIFLLLLGATVAFAGCNAPAVNRVESARPQAAYNVVADKRINMDHRFARRLQVDFVNEGQEEDLRLVQVNLVNTTRSPIQFQYRFDWINEQGISLPSPTSTWVVRTVEAGEPVSLRSVAPTPRATDFRFQVMAHHTRL